MAGDDSTEPVWSDGKATGNRATREAIGVRVDRDGAFYFCLQSSPEDTPELTGALEADMTRAQVERMLDAVRTPLERRWPFAEEPATHALQADSVHYALRAPWGLVHEHDLPDKQVFVTVHDRKDQEWLTRTLEEALRVMAKYPRRPKPAPVPKTSPADSQPDSAADSKADSTADSQPDSAADSKADSAAHSKADSTAHSKADSKPDSAADSKADSAADSKADSTGDSKTDSTADSAPSPAPASPALQPNAQPPEAESVTTPDEAAKDA